MAIEQLSTSTTDISVDRERRLFIMERVLRAPRGLVWRVHTESQHLERWWGPREWSTTNKAFAAKPAGVWHYCMRGPDGMESWGKGIFRELVEPERIVWVDVFSDASGATNEEMPAVVITIEFTDLGDGTTKVRWTGEYATQEALDAVLAMGVVEGASQCWDRLAEYVESLARA